MVSWEALRPGSPLRALIVLILVFIVFALVAVNLPDSPPVLGRIAMWAIVVFFALVTVSLLQQKAPWPIVAMFLTWVAGRLVFTVPFPNVRLGPNAVTLPAAIFAGIYPLLWVAAAFVAYQVFRPEPSYGQLLPKRRFTFHGMNLAMIAVEAGLALSLAVIAAGIVSQFVQTTAGWRLYGQPLAGAATFVLYGGLVSLGHLRLQRGVREPLIPGFALVFAYVGLAVGFFTLLFEFVPPLNTPETRLLVWPTLQVARSLTWYVFAYLLTSPLWWQRQEY